MTYLKSFLKQELSRSEQGFTLIELSIVLVIIGLIIGGVLVGQDLIRAAEIRATVSQVEKYNTAVHTFQVKYNAIPGDMSATLAAQFGFGTRAGTVDQGDGNGVIDGWAPLAGSLAQGGQGETALFWVDLSSINLIDGQFNEAAAAPPVAVSATAIPTVLPPAKLGRNAYFYVYEVNGANFYGLSSVTAIAAAGTMTSQPNLTVAQAYNIDKKMDDGYPNTGNVQGVYVNAGLTVGLAGAHPVTTGAFCLDSATPLTYAVYFNNGSGAACALSFAFQ